MNIAIQRDLLRVENMHLRGLLVVDHSLNRQQVLVLQQFKASSFLENCLDHIWLNSGEINDSGQHRERVLLLVIGLNFVERSKRSLLFSLLKVLIQSELVLFCEYTAWEFVRLS
jgi:hypothetical protein